MPVSLATCRHQSLEMATPAGWQPAVVKAWDLPCWHDAGDVVARAGNACRLSKLQASNLEIAGTMRQCMQVANLQHASCKLLARCSQPAGIKAGIAGLGIAVTRLMSSHIKGWHCRHDAGDVVAKARQYLQVGNLQPSSLSIAGVMQVVSWQRHNQGMTACELLACR